MTLRLLLRPLLNVQGFTAKVGSWGQQGVEIVHSQVLQQGRSFDAGVKRCLRIATARATLEPRHTEREGGTVQRIHMRPLCWPFHDTTFITWWGFML